jgi:hypothetical protein
VRCALRATSSRHVEFADRLIGLEQISYTWIVRDGFLASCGSHLPYLFFEIIHSPSSSAVEHYR